MRLASGRASANPNPPASSAGANPRGSSSSASGLPRVSARIRSRTRASTRPGTTDSSNERASSSGSPSTRSSGRPASSSAAPDRAPRTPWRCARPAGGGRRMRAPAPTRDRASARPRRGTRAGASSAASASRLSTARATRKRSGGLPACMPKATCSASCCGAGSVRNPVEHRRAQVMQPGERQLHLRLHAGGPRDAAPAGPLGDVLQQRGLADPGLAAQYQHRALARPRVRCSTPSSAAHSSRRSRSIESASSRPAASSRSNGLRPIQSSAAARAVMNRAPCSLPRRSSAPAPGREPRGR